MSTDGEWLARYHDEHAAHGGAAQEFHERAATWVRDCARLRAAVADLTRQRDEALAMFEAAHERQKRAEADVADLRAHAEAMALELSDWRRNHTECTDGSLPCPNETCVPDCPVAAYRRAHPLPPVTL